MWIIAFLIADLILIGGALLFSQWVLKALADLDLWFTNRETNYIKYIDRGGQLDHMMAEVPGFILENPRSREARFRKARTPDEKQPSEVAPAFNRYLERKYGI